MNAIASSATSQSPHYAYVEAHLVYGAIQVSGPNGANDGGSSPSIDKMSTLEPRNDRSDGY